MSVCIACGSNEILIKERRSSGSSSKTPVTTTIPGTPAGSYDVTVAVKGTGGSYGGDTSDHPMAVTLTVQ
jgi:hypothetical protein